MAPPYRYRYPGDQATPLAVGGQVGCEAPAPHPTRPPGWAACVHLWQGSVHLWVETHRDAAAYQRDAAGSGNGDGPEGVPCLGCGQLIAFRALVRGGAPGGAVS